jgi:hypothetical protein
MGSYAECWLGDFYVGSSKYDVDPGLIRLFRPSDKRVTCDPHAVVPPQIERWLGDLEEENGQPVVYYAAPVSVVRDRLEIMGYTLQTSREAFEEYVKRERQQYELDENTPAQLRDHYTKTQALLAELNADSWLAGLREIRRLGLKPSRRAGFEGPYQDALIGYMQSEDWYGFPGPDVNVALRLALEVCPEAEQLVYDITDLIWSGDFNPEQDLVQSGLSLSAEQYHAGAKIIVLTEGRSDSRILEESLVLLYPHLADYYSFMDFDVARVGGGAGNLANFVKAFAGAGIINRTIALFDNDTAGASAIASLEGITLPPHIRVLRLPELELLRSYPTIGPSGNTAMDVNGVAASLELYLGEDVLLLDEKQLIPIQWTGFHSRMQQYQGEVLHKERIHGRFRKKLESAKSDGIAPGSEQWNGLKAIFSDIFSAFHAFAKRQICDSAREFCGRSY